MKYYYLDKEQCPTGPYELDELKELYNQQKISVTTLVAELGGKEWFELSNIIYLDTETNRFSADSVDDKKNGKDATWGAFVLGIVIHLIVIGLAPDELQVGGRYGFGTAIAILQSEYHLLATVELVAMIFMGGGVAVKFIHYIFLNNKR